MGVRPRIFNQRNIEGTKRANEGDVRDDLVGVLENAKEIDDRLFYVLVDICELSFTIKVLLKHELLILIRHPVSFISGSNGKLVFVYQHKLNRTRTAWFDSFGVNRRSFDQK